MRLVLLFVLLIVAFEMYEKGMFDWAVERFQLSPYHTTPPIPDENACENSADCANFAYHGINDVLGSVCTQCDPKKMDTYGVVAMSRQPGLVRQPRNIL